MSIKKILKGIFKYNGPSRDKSFSLEETELEQQLAADGDIKGDLATSDRPAKESVNGKDSRDQKNIRADLQENKRRVETIFHIPLNKDIVIRNFTLGEEIGVKAFLVFMDGMADKNIINKFILEPLMLYTGWDQQIKGLYIIKKLISSYLPNNQVTEISNLNDVIDEVTDGNTVIFFERCTKALSVETINFEGRSVNTAKVEQVVQGPQEGFIENIRANISLIRKIMHSENLITEFLRVGQRSKTKVAIMYILDLASPQLIQEVKRRISNIKIDYLSETGMLEEMIEDYPLSILPQILRTERPDRIASSLAEGKVAILVGNNPFAMVVPATFFSFIQSSEDYYVRFPYGYWIRILRFAAIILTLILPAFYVAIAIFHQEMLPTDLILSISAAKERVPFPTVPEILLMEISFELIREAGIRVPGVVGQTLSIVGTLILGQAVVAASLVSPISVIIVAMTGLASYAIPNYETAFGLRFMRFIFIFLAAILGFLGISTGLSVMLCFLINMKSFGVPFMAPVAPRTATSGDVIVRKPLWAQEQRPDYAQPQDVQRQPNISRSWAKQSPKESEGKNASKTEREDKND